VASHSPSSDSEQADQLWLRQHFTTRLAALDADRAGYWSTWRDLAAHFAPRRGRFLQSANDTTRGKRKDQRIIDNTPLLAARVLGSGMMAGISSPARPWFRLRLADDAATAQDGVRQWLDEVQKSILHVFAKSNLYNALAQLYEEIGTFGTSVLWVDEDEEDVVRGYTLTVGEYWLASSQRLAVDTLYRSMWWTVRQIVDRFGIDRVSEGVAALYRNGQLDREFEIVQVIEPNPNATPRARGKDMEMWRGTLAGRMPIRSVWFERATQSTDALLKVSGYEESPVMAPRWSVTGSETYGSSPCWAALGDAMGLQVQQRQKLEAIAKMVKPPMVAPPSMRNEPASLLPGGVTYVADPTGQSFRSAIDIRIDLSHLGKDILDTQGRIKSACYADLFLMMAESDRREITAREIDERHEEKMLMLGPVLERLHDELLDPLIVRVFNIMARRHLLPPPPQGLRIEGMQIEFISMLASAQKAAASASIERVWQFAGNIAGAKPEVMDRMDADGTMEAYADMLGVGPKILVPLDKADAVRKQRSRQAAMAQSMQQAMAAVQGAKTLSETHVGGGINALQRVTGQA
jgi:hypothetical protein